MLSNTLRLNFPKTIGHILKNNQNIKCVCVHEIIRLIIIKMKMKMNDRSRINNIIELVLEANTNIVNIESVSDDVLLCIQQHLSNIWSSIHEKTKQHWGWVEKKLCL